MTTKAKKDEATEGAEPEVKTAATVADGNAQNAENVAKLRAEQAKGEEADAKTRAEAEKLLADLEARRAKLQAQERELDAKMERLAQQLDQPKSRPATIKLRSKALEPRKALANLADIWPDKGQLPAPMVVVAKTYRVTPIGSAAPGMPIAEVSNCSDEGDAKAAYAMSQGGRHVAVEVEEIGREEYTRANEATADPASTDA